MMPEAGSDIEVSQTRRCPHCAEEIQQAANVCRFCGRDVGEALVAGKRRRTIVIASVLGLVGLLVAGGAYFYLSNRETAAVQRVKANLRCAEVLDSNQFDVAGMNPVARCASKRMAENMAKEFGGESVPWPALAPNSMDCTLPPAGALGKDDETAQCLLRNGHF